MSSSLQAIPVSYKSRSFLHSNLNSSSTTSSSNMALSSSSKSSSKSKKTLFKSNSGNRSSPQCQSLPQLPTLIASSSSASSSTTNSSISKFSTSKSSFYVPSISCDDSQSPNPVTTSRSLSLSSSTTISTYQQKQQRRTSVHEISKPEFLDYSRIVDEHNNIRNNRTAKVPTIIVGNPAQSIINRLSNGLEALANDSSVTNNDASDVLPTNSLPITTTKSPDSQPTNLKLPYDEELSKNVANLAKIFKEHLNSTKISNNNLDNRETTKPQSASKVNGKIVKRPPPIARKPTFLRKKSASPASSDRSHSPAQNCDSSSCLSVPSVITSSSSSISKSVTTTTVVVLARQPSPSTSSASLTESSDSSGSLSSQSGRPLPPPPVPPRPKLIPAHYARKSPTVDKRDCGVDTSENGFLAFHSCEKQVQVKPSLGGALVSRDTSLDLDELKETLNSVCDSLADFPSNKTPVPPAADEEEEEPTIVEELKTNAVPVVLSSSNGDIRDDPATITSNTVYMDANSNLDSDQVTPALPVEGKADWSDDDTINDNDDLSSLSSNYQSICSSHPSQTSWVHQEQQRRESLSEQAKSRGNSTSQPNNNNTASTLSDEYETAAENITLSNRTSITSEDLNSFEQFQQQFTNVSLENAANNQNNSDITIEDVADDNNNNNNQNNAESDAQLSNNKSSNRQSLISTESTISELSSTSSSESSSNTSLSNQSSPQSTIADVRNVVESTISAAVAAAQTTAAVPPEGTSVPVASSILENSQLRENISKLPTTTPKGLKADKLYYTVHEMYSTERDYVAILRMLTGEFRQAITDHVSKEFIEEFFRPFDTVLPINERFLLELTNRVLKDWDDIPKISDLIIDICPYFKEYSIYVRQFDRLRQMLSETRDQNSNFNEALCTFERSSRCCKLPINAFLLKPIQRLPQYPMMLKNYLGKLKPETAEYVNTEKAIKIVTDVVEHLNNVRLYQKTAMELNELWSRIFFAKTTYNPYKSGRELLKYGHLQKVSRKDLQERYFILFNDALLYLIPVMNDSHKLKEVLPLRKMEIRLPTQPDDKEFSVISVKRSFALIPRTIKERDEWVDALKNAISEYESNQESFKTASLAKSQSSIQIGSDIGNSSPVSTLSKQSSLSSSTSFRATSDIVLLDNQSDNLPMLGERAPVWVHDRRVTMCQLCLKSFTFYTRRHHCRACGYVVCNDCSTKARVLNYLRQNDNNTPVRVCDLCDEQLSQTEQILLNNNYPSNNNNNNNNGVALESDAESIVSNDNDPNISTESGNSTPNASNISFDSSQCGSPQIPLTPLDLSNLDRLNIVRNSYRLKKHISSVLVEVPANDKQVLISGYLLRLTQQKRVWKRYWFLIKDKVLYTYREREDVAALETLPLLGYDVSPSEVGIKNCPADLTIKLSHPGQATVYFFTESPELYSRWMNAFRKCINLY